MSWRMRRASGKSRHSVHVNPSEAWPMYVALKRMRDVLSSLKKEAGAGWVHSPWRPKDSILVSLSKSACAAGGPEAHP